MRINVFQQEQANFPSLGKPSVPLQEATGIYPSPPNNIAWRIECMSFDIDKPQAIKPHHNDGKISIIDPIL